MFCRVWKGLVWAFDWYARLDLIAKIITGAGIGVGMILSTFTFFKTVQAGMSWPIAIFLALLCALLAGVLTLVAFEIRRKRPNRGVRKPIPSAPAPLREVVGAQDTCDAEVFRLPRITLIHFYGCAQEQRGWQMGGTIQTQRDDAYYFSQAVRQGALDRRFIVWGREYHRGTGAANITIYPLVQIEPEHFKMFWIDALNALSNDDNTRSHTYTPYPSAEQDQSYIDLRVETDAALAWLKNEAPLAMADLLKSRGKP